MQQMESSTGWNKDGFWKEKQPETLPIIPALFIFIFILNERSAHNCFFLAPMKKAKFSQKSTSEIFNLGIINTSWHSANCLFNALYVFCYTLHFHPACAPAEYCARLHVDVHARVCVVTVFQLSLLFWREKKWQLSTQGVVIKNDNI